MVQKLAGAHPGWNIAAAHRPRPAGGTRVPPARRSPRRGAATAPALGGGALRVEHRDGGDAEVLGCLPAGTPRHHATLAPFASHLRQAGRTSGEVALVEADTGAVLARRRLRP